MGGFRLSHTRRTRARISRSAASGRYRRIASTTVRGTSLLIHVVGQSRGRGIGARGGAADGSRSPSVVQPGWLPRGELVNSLQSLHSLQLLQSLILALNSEYGRDEVDKQRSADSEGCHEERWYRFDSSRSTMPRTRATRRTTMEVAMFRLSDCAEGPPERRGEFSDLFGPPRQRGPLFEPGTRVGILWTQPDARRLDFLLQIGHDGHGTLTTCAASLDPNAETVMLKAARQPAGGRRWWMQCPTCALTGSPPGIAGTGPRVCTPMRRTIFRDAGHSTHISSSQPEPRDVR
jgi:hypothetical protein